MSKRNIKKILALTALLLAILFNRLSIQKSPSQDVGPDNLIVDAEVVKVIDGDTIEVNISGETKKVRLLGIDTPETVDPRKEVECFGKEASDKTKNELLNKKIKLEQDPTQANIDKYGRILRYVFLNEGINFNQKMISDGYAYEYTYQTPYKYQKEFKDAQLDAETNKRGLWADNMCN